MTCGFRENQYLGISGQFGEDGVTRGSDSISSQEPNVRVWWSVPAFSFDYATLPYLLPITYYAAGTSTSVNFIRVTLGFAVELTTYKACASMPELSRVFQLHLCRRRWESMPLTDSSVRPPPRKHQVCTCTDRPAHFSAPWNGCYCSKPSYPEALSI